jgi:hypothetical protein
VNTEELEQSLKSEFENYIKTALAGMRQEASEFQSRVQSQLDEAFKGFAERLDASAGMDEAFASSVSEHLRLARDEGARIAADAMVEAEQMSGGGASAAPAPARYDAILEAVNDISAQDSQSAILRSLVQHAEQFAARGAFFIIKNEHFVGWKVFGADESAENTIREVHFPVSADTMLAEAVNSASSTTTGHMGDGAFLDPLNFGHPGGMLAVPLVARGKGVAVLYVDGGETNREAIETLVRVAGLTVELRAAGQPADEEAAPAAAAPAYEPQPQTAQSAFTSPSFEVPSPAVDDQYARTMREMPAPAYEPEPAAPQPPPADFSFGGESIPFADAQPAAPVVDPFRSPFEAAPEYQPQPEPQPEPEVSTAGAMVFDSGGSIEPAASAPSPFEAPAADLGSVSSQPAFEPAPVVAEPSYERGIEQVTPVESMPAPASRYSDRQVDLPIDVPESERRIHNDARRFARLLVSEIKLYNEKKVLEGRQAHDLYDRLREAIDRSREMYDKRVQPPVAAKFDYFHYELVNSLAEGNVERLGGGYPGASV